MTSTDEYYPTDEAVRRYRAAALRKTGRRIGAEEARIHLLRWRRLVWEHRPADSTRECA
jgi:hypothetical protein